MTGRNASGRKTSAGELVRVLQEAQTTVAFTGAGISTESGIPDFRSPGGVWSRHQPVYYQDFLDSEEERRRYWRIKKEGYADLKDARPNRGHRALAALEAAGKLAAVITQNIDGLHRDAGSRRVLELHGTSRHTECVVCGARYDPVGVHRRLDAGEEVPACDACGGPLKSGTVSFGQPMPMDVLSEAFAVCRRADLVLAIGSSLVVEPAASLPLEARLRGARLVLINRDETPLDPMAHLILREPIGQVLWDAATGLVPDLTLTPE